MSRPREIDDLAMALIEQWRRAGRSWPWIGRALARAQGRAIAYRGGSVAAAYRRWLRRPGA
jgi:hypothetical protein